MSCLHESLHEPKLFLYERRDNGDPHNCYDESNQLLLMTKLQIDIFTELKSIDCHRKGMETR